MYRAYISKSALHTFRDSQNRTRYNVLKYKCYYDVLTSVHPHNNVKTSYLRVIEPSLKSYLHPHTLSTLLS